VAMQDRRCVDEGKCYPTNHVAAVIDNCLDAEADAEALRSAGFVDVYWFHGVEAFVAIQAASRYDGSFIRALRWICELGDEGEVREHLFDVLYSGGSVLIVNAATPLQVRHVCNILALRHAHDLQSLELLTVEHLP
jgi:hypothetical protein